MTWRKKLPILSLTGGCSARAAAPWEGAGSLCPVCDGFAACTSSGPRGPGSTEGGTFLLSAILLAGDLGKRVISRGVIFPAVQWG